MFFSMLPRFPLSGFNKLPPEAPRLATGLFPSLIGQRPVSWAPGNAKATSAPGCLRMEAHSIAVRLDAVHGTSAGAGGKFQCWKVSVLTKAASSLTSSLNSTFAQSMMSSAA